VTKPAKALGAPVTPEDVIAYIAAVMAHPACTARFKADLVRPGLRVPLTADKALFDEAAALGREVVWLHCYGERFVDAPAGRPKGPPRLPENERPSIPADGAIPGAPEPLPETMDYDAAKRRLIVGKGFVTHVTPAMRNYEISGKTVLDQWFSYRRRDRTKPMIGDKRPPSPLEKIQPNGWLAEYRGSAQSPQCARSARRARAGAGRPARSDRGRAAGRGRRSSSGVGDDGRPAVAIGRVIWQTRVTESP
jgi:Type ISP C-terminal specificity domain